MTLLVLTGPLNSQPVNQQNFTRMCKPNGLASFFLNLIDKCRTKFVADDILKFFSCFYIIFRRKQVLTFHVNHLLALKNEK